MNKPVDLLYDEFVDSIAPEAILSKLKKSELIELLLYAHEDLQGLESYGELEFENAMLHNQKAYIIDDIYLNKAHAWNWTDEELAYLNAVYDRYMKELLS